MVEPVAGSADLLPYHWRRALVVAVACLAILLSLWKLDALTRGVLIETQRLGPMPVTIFRPAPDGARADAPPGATPAAPPVVLIAHGFAGSQPLMLPFALTLARHGYVAITFDFPGHGRHREAMPGGLADQDASLRSLLGALDNASTLARRLAGAPGRYAVVGHSMASDIVVRHAQAHPEVQATVAVSLFAPSITADTPPDRPRNLLVIDGALEPEPMVAEARRVIALAAGDATELDRTYGDFAQGSARRAVLSPGVEHIGVLYSAATLRETLDWLGAAFPGSDVRASARADGIDDRGPWLGLLLLGVLALAWPLSRGLGRFMQPASPGAMRMPRPPRARWRHEALPTLLPAVLTPLILWKVPTDFLPLLLGDYLCLHFALYGALSFAGLALQRRWPAPLSRTQWPGWLAALLPVTAWALLAVGLPIDRHVFNLTPEIARLPLIAAMFAGVLPWFLADEWMTRHPRAAPGAYFVTKLCFLLSLVLAIALNPERLFFLAILVPAIVLMFVVYGLFSRWIFRSTGHPALAAVAHALAFAWFIALAFPMVS